ncbi:MAG: Gfo/Idh/MocA family oxidoreductase [Pirellulales bacterium]|nr:Gfo/Idh/MocA family oxidoreductase [Thermoguttaceae bacterium]MDD4786417.1 Gfo/Idh/MocA family oxidoreductase [Pirellulales bacterium]MDI9443948.1 Gfo/Idh/MocA family oxidoreductase [Planctomycetota bacterium]
MTTSRRISRRRMLGATLGGISLPAFFSCQKAAPPRLAGPPGRPGSEPDPEPGPNEQIGVGIIGCGRRNGQLVIGKGGQGAPPAHARIVAVADFNPLRAAEWARNYRAKAYSDYRELLDRKDVEVVIYATPEHWHYLPCIHACQAGKDIYGEQPLSHTIREGRTMIQAVRKYKRVFQTGEQQRSHPATRKAVELIRNGRIGKIQSIIGYNYPSPYECNFAAQPIPPGLNWDAWCGPNEVVPYHTDLYLSRIPYEREPPYYTRPAEKYAVGPGWMSFWPYSGGELPNWGCHGLSMVHWALDMDLSGPVEIWVDPEEKMEQVVYDTPDTRDRGDAACSQTIIHYKYANGVVLSLSSVDPKLGGGATFIGEKGRITIFREGYECDPAGLDEDPLPAGAARVYESDNHMENFFACVASRKDPIMPVEAGHSVATLCHLGNIARWLGRRLKWDPEKEVFPGDDEANGYLDTKKRQPYELPTEV